MLRSKSTLPTGSRSWQSGKILALGDLIVALLQSLHAMIAIMQRSAMIAKGVGAMTATMQRIAFSACWPSWGGRGCPHLAGVGTGPPWATTWAKRPKCRVFPDDFTPLGQ